MTDYSPTQDHREKVLEILNDYEFVRNRNGNTGLLGLLYHVQANADWLSDKEIEQLFDKVMSAIEKEETE